VQFSCTVHMNSVAMYTVHVNSTVHWTVQLTWTVQEKYDTVASSNPALQTHKIMGLMNSN
jgi:hypothetical protein